MKNLFKKLIILMIALLCLSACGSGGRTQKAQTREDTQKLADEFFAGLTEQSKYKVLTYYNDELQSTLSVDGDKAVLHYASEEFPDVYMFVENGIRYSMYEGSEPYEDESSYSLTVAMTKDMFKSLVDGILQEDRGLQFNSALTRSEKNGSEERELVIETTSDNAEDGTLVLTGKAEGDKFISYRYESRSGESTVSMSSVFEYGDDIAVDVPEHFIPEPRVYKHVESPYETMGEVIDELGDNFYLVLTEDKAYTIDGMLQLRATLTDDVVSAIETLDINDEGYTTKRNELIKDLKIDDCIDFSEYVLSKDELDTYVGKTVGDLIDEGFESNGWSIEDEGSVVWIEKEDMIYEADVELAEGFDYEADIEFEDLYDARIKSMKFLEVNLSLLPME